MISIFAILFVLAFRILPHAPNFAPMGAVAILSGRAQSRWAAALTTIGAMLVSDFYLSQVYGYPFLGFISLFVYGAFLLQMLLGRFWRRKAGGSLAAAFVGAFVFFFVTNFGVWLQGGMYERNLSGLVQCYVMAIPFFKGTLLGNMIWTPVLGLAYRLYTSIRHVPSAATLPVV